MTTSFLKYVSYIPNEVLIKWNLDAKVFNEKAFQAIFWYTWQLFCTFLPPNFWYFCNFGNYNLVFLVSGAPYEASYETLFALVFFDSPLSKSKVIQNWCKRSLVQSFVRGSTD